MDIPPRRSICAEIAQIARHYGMPVNGNVRSMRTLEQLYKQIEEVADFSGVKVTDPNTSGLFSTRPLHIAAVWGDCEAITMLVEAGANINEKGEHGFTPLLEAVAQGHIDAVKKLVELGANPIRNIDGDLPSEYASISNHQEIADYLKKHGF